VGFPQVTIFLEHFYIMMLAHAQNPTEHMVSVQKSRRRGLVGINAKI